MRGGDAPSIQLLVSSYILRLGWPCVQPPQGFFRAHVTKKSPVELNIEAALPNQCRVEELVCDRAKVDGR